MAFESGIVPEDWRSSVIVPLYKDKGERTECSNYKGISLLSVVGKIYPGILVDRVRKVTEGLIDDEQGGFRAGRGCVDQICTLKQIGEKARERKRRVYVGFMDLEKAYDRVNRETLWQVLKMYDVGGKLLNGIKSMYVNSLVCVIVKGGESESFRINGGVRQGCIMSPWLFNVYMDAVMKEVKMGMWRRGMRFHNGGKRMEMVLGGEEGLECEVCLDEIHLEHVSEFKYLGCVLDESGTDEADCSRKMASGRRVAGVIRYLINGRSLQLECARVLHEGCEG